MTDKKIGSRISSGNIFVVLAYRFLLIMLLFSMCRIGFFLFNFQDVPGSIF